MRNRKAEMLACGPCECRTLQCWRYANENCGCGDSGAFVVGNKVYVEFIDVETSTSRVRYFTTWKSWKDYILQGQTGMELVGAFDSAGGQALQEVISNNDYYGLFTFGKWWVFPAAWAIWTIDADAMVLVTKVFEDPSEENKQELTSFLDTHMEAIQQWDANAYLVTYPVETSITFLPIEWEVSATEQIEITAVVSPNSESITAASSNPSILRVDSVEKATGTLLNLYNITCTWIAAWTATITATCVNDPSVSATTPTITVTSGGDVNSISTHVETISLNETRFMSVEVVVDPYTASDVSFTAVSSDPNVLEIQNIIMYDEPTEWAVWHINVRGVGQWQCNLVITSVANPNATVTVPAVVGENIPVQTVTPSSNSFTIDTDTLAVPVTLTDWYVDITPTNATNVADDVSFYNNDNILGWGWITDVSAEGRVTYTFNPVAYGTADYILQCGENTQTISVTVVNTGA